MSRERIRAAFEQRIAAWALANSLAFLAENTEADKPGQYVRGFLLPGRTISQDLLGTHRRYIGIYQVDICLPKGSGPGDADALVTSLEAQFPDSAQITEAGCKVVILEPVSAANGRIDDTHYVVPCSVPYRADTVS